MKKRIATLSSIFTLLLLTTAGAALAGPGVEVVHGSASIDFVAAHEGVTVTVSGPGFDSSKSFKAGQVPSVSLFDADGNRLAAGSYTWEMVFDGEATGDRSERREAVMESGSFTIQADGSFADSRALEGGSNKDQVILDDLIVNGSICAGLDCNNGESFGFDTLRLKENNLRIRAQDTSNSASFPTNDWQITFNDSSNGGKNKFSIDDIDGGRTPFTIEASAPSHSLYVEDGGRIGFGTSTPVVDLHVKSGNTPTLRLEQDGSSGFTAQTWDVAGNEAGFFVRDATTGSTLPFRILPGAPSEALVIEAGGNVGMGVGTNPEEALHIRRTSGNARMILETTSASDNSQFFMRTGGAGNWRMSNLGTSGALLFARDTSGNEIFANAVAIRPATDATVFNVARTMSVAGDIEATSFMNLSSRDYKTDLVELDSQDVLSKVAQMSVSAWQYKWDKAGARHLGPMAEDFTESFGVGDGKSIRLGDASGVALAAIKGVFELVQEKDALIQALEQRISELESRIAP